MVKYNAVLMVTSEKIPLLKKTYDYLLNNIGADKIIMVASKSCEKAIRDAFGEISRIEYMDEDGIFPGLTLKDVKSRMNSICGDDKRAGWFFQQFLKMAYCYVCRDDYYLVFDSDTIPLNPVRYFDENERPGFVIKREYHQPYFDTLQVLFDGRVERWNREISFIAENMMISVKIMREIIDEIMSNNKLSGTLFYERILNAIDSEIIWDTGFSEFETYGNYVMTYYPNMYNCMKLRTQRMGAFLFGDDPDREQLEWAAGDYDIISIESHGRKWLAKKTKSAAVREKYSAADLFNHYKAIADFCDKIRKIKPVNYD